MAKLLTAPYPLPEQDYSDFYMPPMGRIPAPEEIPEKFEHEREFYRLLRISDELPTDTVKGAMLRWQRGDGFAYYLVVEERPLTLQWVPFGDAWQVEAALIRGLTVNEVRQMVHRERAIAELFGKKEN